MSATAEAAAAAKATTTPSTSPLTVEGEEPVPTGDKYAMIIEASKKIIELTERIKKEQDSIDDSNQALAAMEEEDEQRKKDLDAELQKADDELTAVYRLRPIPEDFDPRSSTQRIQQPILHAAALAFQKTDEESKQKDSSSNSEHSANSINAVNATGQNTAAFYPNAFS